MEDLMPVELRGIVPRVGSIWEWEPLKPNARETVRVTRVWWTGDECWVESETVAYGPEYGYPKVPRTAGNELDRWVEATVLVTPAPGDE
jgi:hypothetical protein